MNHYVEFTIKAILGVVAIEVMIATGILLAEIVMTVAN